MKKRDGADAAGKREKVLLKTVAVIAAYAGLHLSFFTPLSKGLIYHNLFRDNFIPAAGWICSLIYAVIWIRFFGVSSKIVLPRMVGLAAIYHIMVVLWKLNVQLAAGSPVALPYIYCVKIATIISLAAMTAASIGIIRAILDSRGDFNRSIFFMPLAVLWAYLALLYARQEPALTVTALMLGLIAVYVSVKMPRLILSAKRVLKGIVADERRLILIIFFFAFVVRWGFSLQILHVTGGGSTFVDASDDGRSYDAKASSISRDPVRELSNGKNLPDIWDPGYILMVSAVYTAFGKNYYALTAIQSALNGLLSVVVYLIARHLFTKRVAIASAFFASLDQALIMYSVVIGTEALFVLFMSCTALFFIRYLKKPGDRKYTILTGVFFGLSFITRSMLMALPLFMLCVSCFVIRKRRFTDKTLDIVRIMAAASFIIIPITVLNYINTGEFHLTARYNDRLIICWESSLVGGEDLSPSNNRLIMMGMDPFRHPLQSAFLIMDDPVRFIKPVLEIYPKRIRNFFFWPNFGFFDPLILVNPSRYANEYGSSAEFYYFILFIIGTVFLVRKIAPDRRRAVLLMMIVYFILIHIGIYRVNTVRYRVPIHPYIVIIYSLGAVIAWDYAVRGIRGR